MADERRALDESLRGLGDLYARYQRLGQRGPARNSLASRDGPAELGQYAWVLGASAMSSAIDHLISWNELRQRVHPTYGHMTLLRGSLEGSVLCRWLVDPKASAEERLRRGAGAQRHDFQERGKFERLRTDPINEGGATAKQRIAELDRAMAKARLKPIQLLGPTDLCARYVADASDLGSGEFVYRLLSAFAHAKQWAILPASDYAQHGPMGDLPGVELVAVRASQRLAGALTNITARTLTVAMDELHAYAGR